MTLHRSPSRLLVAALLVAVAAGGLSCRDMVLSASGPAREEPAAFLSPAGSASRKANDEVGVETKQDRSASDEAAIPRRIIREGEVRLVVEAWEPARKAIGDLVGQAGGFLASSKVQHNLGRVSSATLVLRIPAGKFGGIFDRILELGVVRSQSAGSRDVTEEYFDLSARLENARKLEARLLDILSTKTAKLADVLAVERELARVRETIERFEGKLRLLDNLVNLSTLTVHLSIQREYVPPRPPTLAGDIAEVLGDSWSALKGFGRGLVLLAVALLPWLIPLGLVAWLAVRWVRRWRRRRAARRTLTSSLEAQGIGEPR